MPQNTLLRRPVCLPLAGISLLALGACSSTRTNSNSFSEPSAALPRGDAPLTNTDTLALEFAGPRALLVDPKDAGLLRMLELLDTRLGELPAQFEVQGKLPPGLVELLLDLLGRPMQLRLRLHETQTAPLPLDMTLAFEGLNVEETAGLAARSQALFDLFGPLTGLPAGMLQANSLTADGKPLVRLALGNGIGGPLGLGALDLPRGVEPVLGLKFDPSKLLPMIQAQLPEAERGALNSQLSLLGMSPDQPWHMALGLGHGKDRAYMSSRVVGGKQLLARMPVLDPEGLCPADLALIPADAHFASVSELDLGGQLASVRRMVQEQNGVDPYELVAGISGIHPQYDVLDYLGSSIGVFAADSTGGGGLLSMVVFVEVKDETALNQSLRDLEGWINGMAAPATRGMLALRRVAYRGIDCTQLQFPGLPVPVELCYAMQGGHLFVGLSAPALQGALDQSLDRGADLSSREDLRAGLSAPWQGALQLTYVDSAYYARQGYPWMTLIAASMANAVRSSTDQARDPGTLLPKLPALLADAHPLVSVTRMEGEDLVGLSQFDRSMSFNLSALVGSPIGELALMSGMLGAAFGIASQAQGDSVEMLQGLGYLPE